MSETETAKLVELQESNERLKTRIRQYRQAAKQRRKVIGARPWGDDKVVEAQRGAPWWAVRRMGPEGRTNHGPMFRHPTLDNAVREAGYLANGTPGAVFVVLEAAVVVCRGDPEVSIGEGLRRVDPAPACEAGEEAEITSRLGHALGTSIG